MTKVEFLNELELRLYGLNDDEKNDILDYYTELIEDKIENEGLTEEDVINELGSLDLIAKRVNPNFTGCNKIKYEEDAPLNMTNKEARIICEVVRIFLIISLVFGSITVFSGITSIAGASIFLLSQGITNMADNLYIGLIMLGFGICLIGILVLVTPLVVRLIKYVRNLIFKFIKWLYIKLT